METVDYIDVLKGAADLCGLDRDNLSTMQQTILRNLLNKRFNYAWRYAKWPDLMRLEKRYYRDVYAAATAYVAGNEVYFPQTQFCYQALTSTTGNAPANSSAVTDTTRWAVCQPTRSANDYATTASYVAGDIVYSPAQDAFYQAIASSAGVAVTDTSKWGALNDFTRYVSKDQTGKTAIGTVWYVWDRNKAADYSATKVEWYRSNLGIQIVSSVALVWVEFRLREQQLTGTTYSAAATYAVNAQIYFTDGNFYRCLTATSAGESPATAAAKWSVRAIPLEWREALELLAAADYMAVDDDTTADRYRMLGEQKLADTVMVFLGQEGLTERVEVLTR